MIELTVGIGVANFDDVYAASRGIDAIEEVWSEMPVGEGDTQFVAQLIDKLRQALTEAEESHSAPEARRCGCTDGLDCTQADCPGLCGNEDCANWAAVFYGEYALCHPCALAPAGR